MGKDFSYLERMSVENIRNTLLKFYKECGIYSSVYSDQCYGDANMQLLQKKCGNLHRTGVRKTYGYPPRII